MNNDDSFTTFDIPAQRSALGLMVLGSGQLAHMREFSQTLFTQQ